MKRIKIMLTSIVVLAGVGGALAFKANAVRNIGFCISATVNMLGVRTCTITTFGKITASAISRTYATILPIGITRCTHGNNGWGTPCTLLVSFTKEE